MSNATSKASSQSIELPQMPGHLIRRLQQIAVAIFLQETGSSGLTPVQYAALQAVANRPVTDEQVAAVVARIEDRLRRRGPRVTSERVGIEILGQLAKLDEVAYLRFASVYKDFQGASDFERELGILQKKSAKPRTP